MLDLKFVRQNQEKVEEALRKRRAEVDLSTFSRLDEERRSLLVESEDLKHRRNTLSQEVGKLKKAGQDAAGIQAQVKDISVRAKELDARLSEVDRELDHILLTIPNIPHERVPEGTDESDNREERTWGEIPRFDFEPKPHWDLGEALGVFDFERAAKLSGARFAVLYGAAARLERALINFMLNLHTQEHGYRETLPPFMVNSETMTGTGQLPKFAEDLFRIQNGDYWLIPTAEVPVTNLHAREVLNESDLPLKYTAYTPCFRAEAGSYGRDTRGLIRQHQFDKVELVTFSLPEQSYDILEQLTSHAEEVLKRLELPYRVVSLSTGDLGFSAAMTYDLEVWLPSAGVYREISSCSNFEDFQARRAGIRFKRAGKKGTELVHTLNGSGLAVGRTLVAIMENYQQADGSVVIPQALRPYMGGMEAIRA